MPTATAPDLSLSEKLLFACGELDRQGYPSYTAEALAVAAWRDDPEAFGLRGFRHAHPAEAKVRTLLMGTKGLPARGLLEKVGTMEYTLTRAGRAALARLNGTAPPAVPTVRLPRPLDKGLRRLLDGSALEKFNDGRKAELTSADAWGFWGLTTHDRDGTVDPKLAAVESLLREAERVSATGDIELGNGRVVSGGEVRVVANLHRWLLDRFARHLNLLRARPADGRD